jgi:DMSO/TMAO reductase YedYZ molybdopterin-dependent catalytic subunit
MTPLEPEANEPVVEPVEPEATEDRGSQTADRSDPPPDGADRGSQTADRSDPPPDGADRGSQTADRSEPPHADDDAANDDAADSTGEVDPAIRDLRSAISADAISARSRRGFITLAAGALTAAVGWKWLRSRPKIDGVEWPLRRVLETNESLARAYFSKARLSPTFRPSDITKVRINGRIGLKPPIDLDAWRLRIEGAASPISLTLDDIKALPRRQMITELRCIEGWSIIVQWTGARLADLLAKYPPAQDPRYIALETPDRGYYVGLDLESALHPQTLLAYEVNGQPLPLLHGAPLRLAIPVKYGIKNIKRIGVIRYTAVRPADFWAERGYDWYAGH